MSAQLPAWLSLCYLLILIALVLSRIACTAFESSHQPTLHATNLQDLCAAWCIRQRHVDDAVKAPWANQRSIYGTRPVGGTQDDQTTVVFEPIHLQGTNAHHRVTHTLIARTLLQPTVDVTSWTSADAGHAWCVAKPPAGAGRVQMRPLESSL